MARPKAISKTKPLPAAAQPPAAPAPASLRRGLKTSEIVALDIVRDIVARQLVAGDKLPLEAEMLRQYRVSRSSLREALRLLEVQGLISIRPGPGGGTVVGQIQPASLGRSLTLHMHLLGATYDEMLDAWVHNEIALAELAALNPDRAKVRALMTPYLAEDARATETIHEIAEGLEFHRAVAKLAENRVLAYIFQMAGSIIGELILTSLDRRALEDEIVHDHTAIAKAIIAGNAKKAAQAMEIHIRHIASQFRAYWPQKVGEPIQWR